MGDGAVLVWSRDDGGWVVGWDLEWSSAGGGELSVLALGAGAVGWNGDGGEGWHDWDDGGCDLAVWAVGHGWGAGSDGLDAGLILSQGLWCLWGNIIDNWGSWNGGLWLGGLDLELVGVLEDLWVGVELDLDSVHGEGSISWDGPVVLSGGGWDTG